MPPCPGEIAGGLILAVVIIEPAALLISFGLVPGIQRRAADLLSMVAAVLFVLFLKRLARYLGRSDLVDQAQSLIIWGLALLGMGIVSAVVLPFASTVSLDVARGIVNLTGLASLIMLVYVLIQYIVLLRCLRQAILQR